MNGRRLRGSFWVALVLGSFVECTMAEPMTLDTKQDEQHLWLVGHHPELGQVFDLWCYEGGPFRMGTAEKLADGRVVFTHKSGGMTATTTFTPVGSNKVLTEVVVEGPLEEVKAIRPLGPCLQFWHAPAFMREGDLAEFVQRCFYYTMRGPVFSLDTARGKMKTYAADAHENNPPCTQWYVPPTRGHPGDIWGFGASGDRPVHSLVGVVSRDGKWIAAIGCKSNLNLGQGWHDCLHYVPDCQAFLDEHAGRIAYRVMMYIMPNDRQKLLSAFLADFPVAPEEGTFDVSGARDGTLRLVPRAAGAPPLTLSLGVRELIVGGGWAAGAPSRAPWERKYWGTFIRAEDRWRMWAHPVGDSLELCVSFAADQGKPLAEAGLSGEGWVSAEAPEGVPAQVMRSADGVWTAAVFWETRGVRPDSEKSEWGVPAAGEAEAKSISVRGRLLLYKGEPSVLAQRWRWAAGDWKNAVPYRMPVEEAR